MSKDLHFEMLQFTNDTVVMGDGSFVEHKGGIVWIWVGFLYSILLLSFLYFLNPSEFLFKKGL